MKKMILMLMAMVVFGNVLGQEKHLTGKIKSIRYHSENFADGSSGWSDNYWVMLESPVSSSCNCKTLTDVIHTKGYIFAIKDSNKKALAMLLAAKMNDIPVTLWVNESKTLNGGYCEIQYIDLVN